jgi:hypothetical protein
MTESTLYTIDAQVPAGIQEDIDWLLEQNDGRMLFEQAFVLHRKPVHFCLDESSLGSRYTDADGIHTVFISPDTASKRYVDQNGMAHSFDMKQVLAHEMAHAGQEGIVGTGGDEVFQKVAAEAFEHFQFADDGAMLQSLETMMDRVIQASNRQEAKEIILKYYHEYFPDIETDQRRYFYENKAYADYMKAFEVPAIMEENKILALLDKPPRSFDYLANVTLEPLYTMDGMAENLLDAIYTEPTNTHITCDAARHEGITAENHRSHHTNL